MRLLLLSSALLAMSTAAAVTNQIQDSRYDWEVSETGSLCLIRFVGQSDSDARQLDTLFFAARFESKNPGDAPNLWGTLAMMSIPTVQSKTVQITFPNSTDRKPLRFDTELQFMGTSVALPDDAVEAILVSLDTGGPVVIEIEWHEKKANLSHVLSAHASAEARQTFNSCKARMLSNYAMQRSSRVGTPLAGPGTGADRVRSASGAPPARRR